MTGIQTVTRFEPRVHPGRITKCETTVAADKHRAAGQHIHLIGIKFSREQRCVVGFAVESL
jgi:hypothetical protein